MELFDKKFVYFMWDDTLRGKECFYDDDIDGLMQTVRNNATDFKSRLEPSTQAYPFKPVCRGHTGCSWRFAYYDPNYECKVAYSKGKLIQHREKGKSIWHDDAPAWDERFAYRIKPMQTKVTPHCFDASKGEPKKRRMTNQELAKWLADGKGQKVTINGNGNAITYHNYELDEDAKLAPDCMIRGWNETEWHEPEVE